MRLSRLTRKSRKHWTWTRKELGHVLWRWRHLKWWTRSYWNKNAQDFMGCLPFSISSSLRHDKSMSLRAFSTSLSGNFLDGIKMLHKVILLSSTLPWCLPCYHSTQPLNQKKEQPERYQQLCLNLCLPKYLVSILLTNGVSLWSYFSSQFWSYSVMKVLAFSNTTFFESTWQLILSSSLTLLQTNSWDFFPGWRKRHVNTTLYR